MGFLLGAFGKLAAGSRYRSLQARLMRVQSRLRRATRDVAEMEKSLDRQKKYALNNLTAQSNLWKQMAQGAFTTDSYLSAMNKLAGNAQATDMSALTDAEKTAMNQYQQGMMTANSSNEQFVAMQKQQIEDYFEYLHDTQLDPLKDEEDSLQLEKDTLESQLQIAKADYEACQKMEQSDAQMMKPNYTGGQG